MATLPASTPLTASSFLRGAPRFTAFLFLIVIALGWLFPAFGFAADVAILKSSDIVAYNLAILGFKADLPASTAFVEYDLEGDLARGRKIARKIRASDVSLVVAVGLKAALAARLEIVDIPVIYAMVLDPEKYDLRAPNFTGISLRVPVERQFGTMKTLLPSLKRVGVIYDPDKTGNLIEEARRSAARLNVELVERQLRSEKELPATVRTLLPKVDAVWLVPDSTVLTDDSLRFILKTALDANVPVIGFSSEFVRNGALAGLSINPEDIGRQAAAVAKRIFSGGVGALHAQAPLSPDRIRLAINLNTASYLGLTIPRDVVGRADEVF